MTGAVVAASRSTRAVRTTISVRALGGWNLDSDSSNPSLGAVSASTLDVMSATPAGIRLILQNVLQGQCRINVEFGASWSQVTGAELRGARPSCGPASWDCWRDNAPFM